MKKVIYIILLLLILVLGINMGSQNNQTKSEVIQDKIEDYEQGIDTNKITQPQNVNPNVLNKVAETCNDLVDKIVKKTIKSLVK